LRIKVNVNCTAASPCVNYIQSAIIRYRRHLLAASYKSRCERFTHS